MIRVETRRLSLWAVLWMVALSACVADFPPVELGPVGSARVVFVLPRAVPADSVARVTVTASTSGFSSSMELEGAEGVWQGRLRSMPAGERYDFRIEAFDAAGARRFEGEVSSEPLESHHPALILWVGGAPGATQQPDNPAPLIEAVVGSRSSVAPAGTILLRAMARDVDAGEELSYSWQADEGTFDDAHSASPRWTAPASRGLRTLTLVVRDSHEGATSLTFTLDVAGVGELSDETMVRLNRWPRAAGLVVAPSATVAVGQEVTLALPGATDEDSDALTYAWSASCEGSRAEGTGSTFRFTPSALPEEATCDNCIVRVRVEDAYGGAVTYERGLCVRNKLPPSILASSSATMTATPGELLKLSVSAEDPAGEPLSFAWKANTGTLGVPVQLEDTSEVHWTALSCVPAGVKPTIEVTVTNSAGLGIRLRYEVSWSGPACGHPECDARMEQELITLEEACTTDTPVFIPDGLTLDGAGRVLTAVDPVGGPFVGAILRNRGATAHVRNVKVRAQGLLTEGCAAGDDRLAGIRLLGASGSVVDSEVTGISRNKRVANNPQGEPWGCQEGFAIEVRNRDASVARQVELLRNSVSGYQKAGLLLSGRMEAYVAGNTVTGAGPVAHIAQNGVQLSDGATGQVMGNQLLGHAYTGGSDSASGILVAGGPYFGIALVRDAILEGNTLTGNDVGINLSQAEADGSSPVTPTRLRVRNNTLRKDAVTSPSYQAGISDLGTANIISSNTITGQGYDPDTDPGITFDVDVLAGAASQVVFLTSPEEVVAGACSERVVVQSQDIGGNLSKPTPAEFNLTASGDAAQGLTFHADPECAGPEVTTVALSTTQAEAAFYFKAPQPGAVTLTVSNGDLSGSQNRTASSP